MRPARPPSGGRAARRSGGPRLALALLAVATPAAGPRAEVLDVGVGGVLAVHEGPEVILSDARTPIRRRPGRASRETTLREGGPTGEPLAAAAALAQLSPDLVAAVAWRESRLRARVVSRRGAVGEMQLMPGTAAALRVDPFDTAQNLRGGAAYLQALLHRYDGDLVRALAAYNAGPGAVDRYHGVPPFPETRAYVAAVLDQLSAYALGGGATPRR